MTWFDRNVCRSAGARTALVAAGLMAGLLCSGSAWAGSARAPSEAESAVIDQAIRDWAQSWDRGNTEQYLGHYAGNFVPAGGLTRDQWENQRRLRIKNSGVRHVMLRDVRVDVAANEARASFVQHYIDMDLISTARKQLTLVKQDGAWKIREERVEDERAVRRY